MEKVIMELDRGVARQPLHEVRILEVRILVPKRPVLFNARSAIGISPLLPPLAPISTDFIAA
mgnify:CR=1 FL=1